MHERAYNVPEDVFGGEQKKYMFYTSLQESLVRYKQLLAIKIREDCNVQGLKIGEEMIKLSVFADDMTCLKRQTLLDSVPA